MFKSLKFRIAKQLLIKFVLTPTARLETIFESIVRTIKKIIYLYPIWVKTPQEIKFTVSIWVKMTGSLTNWSNPCKKMKSNLSSCVLLKCNNCNVYLQLFSLKSMLQLFSIKSRLPLVKSNSILS